MPRIVKEQRILEQDDARITKQAPTPPSRINPRELALHRRPFTNRTIG